MQHCDSPQDLSYFYIPKDKRQKIWANLCKRKDAKFNPNNARICERHFSAKNFKSGSIRKLLKADAIPDQDLPIDPIPSAKYFKVVSIANPIAKPLITLEKKQPSLAPEIPKQPSTISSEAVKGGSKNATATCKLWFAIIRTNRKMSDHISFSQ